MQNFTIIKKVGLAVLLAVSASVAQSDIHAQTNDTIGTANVVTNNYGPCRIASTGAASFSTKTINLYTQGELAIGGIVPGSVINAVSWRKVGINNLQNGYSVNIAVSFRDQVSISSYGSTSSSTTYIDNYIGSNFTAAGSQIFSSSGTNFPADSVWVTINLTTPFTYTGGNLEVLTNAVLTAGTGNPSTAAINWKYTTSSASTIYPTMYSNNVAAYNNTATATLSPYRPNVIFNYTPGPNCTGTPNAGIISMDTTKACPGMLAGNLKLTGASVEGGVTVVWQKKGQSDPAFIDMATSSAFALVNQSISEPTQYRVNVTCNTSGLTVTSPIFNMLPTASYVPNYIANFDFPTNWFSTTVITNCWEGRKGLMDYPVSFLTSGGTYAAGSWAGDGWNNIGTLGAAKIRPTATTYDWFLTPVIDLGTGNYQLDFDFGVFPFNASGAGIMGSDDLFDVVISTDGGATFSQADIIKEVNSTNTTFPLPNGTMHITVPLTQYSGNVKLGFFATGGSLDPTPSSLTPDVMIDNVQINPLGTVLPVKMGLLEAVVNKSGHSALSWKTYTEENNAGFTIQKSLDGKIFRSIGTIKSKAANGNSQTMLNYNFIDAEQNDMEVYYRIVQTDNNNYQSFSNVVRLFYGQGQNDVIHIFPNPSSNEININFNGIINETDLITITDLTGNTLITKASLSAQMKLDISKLPAGIYFVNIIGMYGISVHKIVKL